MIGYSPVGDLMVVAICLVMVVLVIFSFVRKTESFHIFLAVIGLLIIASLADVAFHQLAVFGQPQLFNLAYVMRCVFHTALFAIFFLYVAYITVVTHLDKKNRRPFLMVAGILFILVVLGDIILTINGAGVRITGPGQTSGGVNIFIWGYVAFLVLIILLLILVRNRLYRKVIMGFFGTILISFLVLLIQGLHGQSSFTVATFLFPVIAMLYVMHSSPYDARMGTVRAKELRDQIKSFYVKNQDFYFMSLYLRSMTEEGREMPEALQARIRVFATDYFRGAMLFQADKGHDVLVFAKKKNPDFEKRLKKILTDFYVEYETFKLDYKIVIGESVDEISRKNEYISFIRNIHSYQPENTVHRIDQKDIDRFSRSERILRELEDIYNKNDLNDPRVLTYCQPVYNIATGKFDTAEALMRLQLDGIGMVFPDQFIPLAERHGFIHRLTEIILHKTCEEVRNLITAGYNVTRISVNVSALELDSENFCDDINRIIDASGIPGEKIAIELTESQTEDDFLVMKEKILRLKERGIKFYLDDFGTGYSNMERIMELPFDIIKFDRSLVLACDSSERSREIVSGLANMFARMNYAVLYEGVEQDAEENMCIGMDASFLQGYKYSRPVPITELSMYFESQAN